MLRRVVNFIGAAALLLGVACAPSTPASGQGGQSGQSATGQSGQSGSGPSGQNVWRLQQILVVSKANGYVSIISDSHDTGGGQVRIAVDGRALTLCPGGQEQLQFSWKFTRDVSQLSDGDVVPAQLDAGIASLSQPCNGSIAGISDITLTQSAGVTGPLPDNLQAQADSDRFVAATPSPGVNWVRANDGPREVQAAVAVMRGPAKPDRNLAYFYVAVGLRGGGAIWWVYLYQRAG